MIESKTGKIIILNGPSCSGKTSIQNAFQKLMLPDLWIKLGIDNLFESVFPPDDLNKHYDFWTNKNDIRWLTNINKDSKKVYSLQLGKLGWKVVVAMNEAIVLYAKNGLNIIVDYVAFERVWLQDLLDKCIDINKYMVAIKIPLNVLEKREKVRNTTPEGFAKGHYHDVYADFIYDAEFDTSIYSSKDIAMILRNEFGVY